MSERENILHVRVTAADAETLRTLLREEPLDVGGRPRETPGPGNEMTIEAYVPRGRAGRLERAGVSVDVLRDATETGRARQAEVGHGDRFADPDEVPYGLGKMVKEEGPGG
ncbi:MULTISPECIES: hypothetical protein [unclassified Streptomyces]|uniref:hypothetical protein n=1 Tax=unclassified Streptomyces TaxID=2593676 RepID=UPI000C27C9CF|nr:hypothetical protein [Streptomyces sp. CB02959]PJN36275.1 hypothetical protein CG747_34700 [Streptomyces sp. CB02959]